MRVPVTVISASGGATVPAGAGEASCACAGRFHSSATVSAVADTIDVDLDMYFPLFSISVRGGRLPEPPEPHRRIIPSYDDGQLPGAGRRGKGRPLPIPVGSPFSSDSECRVEGKSLSGRINPG